MDTKRINPLALKRSCDKIYNDFITGKLNKKEAFVHLWKLEHETYNNYPDSEEDGEITYIIASVAEKIDKI